VGSAAKWLTIATYKIAPTSSTTIISQRGTDGKPSRGRYGQNTGGMVPPTSGFVNLSTRSGSEGHFSRSTGWSSHAGRQSRSSRARLSG
jgi:hypothetical protein